MTKLQDDFLNIYNSLVEFSEITLRGALSIPICVSYDISMNSLFFEQRGKKVGLTVPNYYSGYLRNIKNSYLLPRDYDYLMATLSTLIESGALLRERVCVSPELFGFDVYETNLKDIKNGPKLLGQIRFISGNSWIFKIITKLKYKKVL